MSRTEFWLLLAPGLYLVLGACFFGGFRCQPRVVHAATGPRFERAVEAAGGPDAVRRGLRVDAGFIVLFLVTAAYLLRSSGAWVIVPIVGALLDAAESFQLTRMLPGGPALRSIRLLAVTAAAKMAVYLLCGVLLLMVFCGLG